MANNKQAKTEREELSALDAAGLKTLLDNTQKGLWNNRFSMGKRQLTNTSEIGKSRKRIARIHTYLKALELQEAKG